MRPQRARAAGGAGAGTTRWTPTWWRVLMLMVVTSALASVLQAQQPGARVPGASVRVILHGGAELRGELLAVEEQRVWVMDAADTTASASLTRIREVRVQRHQWSARRVFQWTAVVGGITSAGMFLACTQEAETGECVGITVTWAAAWAAVGGISGLLIRPSLHLRPAQGEQLRAYARFPQGLPEGYLPLQRTDSPRPREDP
jgi:hypothetical protein